MRSPTTFISLFLFAFAAPAAADWQFTKWGMTPEQVIKKSPVKISKLGADEQAEQEHQALTTEKGMTALLESDWASGAFRFHALYRFDASRHLSAIDLTILDDSQARDVANALSQKYGKPDEESGPGDMLPLRRWTTPSETIQYTGPLISQFGQKGFHGWVVYISRKNAAANGM